MESLLFLNDASGKFMQWPIRIMYPRLIKYQFTTRRNEVVNATKFEAYLVANVATEYVLASVPFSFKDQDKAARALQKYVSGTAWTISSILLDSSSKAQWNGSPNKNVVVLDSPTKSVPLMQGSDAEKSIASYLEPPMRLADILEVTQTQAVDCIALIEDVQPVRKEVARGKDIDVCSVVVVDDSNARATITCWDEQARLVQGRVGQTALLLGLIAVHDNQQVKLSLRSSGVIDFTHTIRSEALQQAWKSRSQSSPITSVTQLWTGNSAPKCDGEAVLVCAAFLKAMSKEEHYASREAFQLMGVYASGNISEIHTKDGQRLYFTGILRDWSGSVPVGFVEACVPVLFGCDDREEVESKFSAHELELTGMALNVRGFKQGQDYQIAQVSLAECLAEPTKHALKLADLAAVCGPSADGIMACAANQLSSTGLLNLGVKLDNGIVIAPFRVMLLVRGTQKSQLITTGTTATSRIVFSQKVKCMLSKEDVFVNIRAYASEDMLLDYKLDSETAVVFVTALKQEDSVQTCVVDKMQKVDSSKEALSKAMKCMKALQEMSIRPREGKDEKRASEFVTPDSMKRARTIHAYPSDA